jgi:integrase
VIGTHKASDETPRDRVLADSELATIWCAASESDYGRIVRLLILTGCRRDEIGALRWSEVDLDAAVIALPGSRTKNGKPHIVPLSEKGVMTLRAVPVREGRDLVFGSGKGGYSGYSRSKEALDAIVKLATPWTIHDLRRTVRTGLGKLGVQPHIAEAVINHLPAQLVRTYDVNAYEAEKRAALDQWAAHIRVNVARITK